jgi:hypothetical protein
MINIKRTATATIIYMQHKHKQTLRDLNPDDYTQTALFERNTISVRKDHAIIQSKKFIELDSTHFPKLLLLHPKLLSKHNQICPFLLDNNEDDCKKWLTDNDLYDLYIKLYERIYTRTILSQINTNIQNSKQSLNTLVFNFFKHKNTIPICGETQQCPLESFTNITNYFEYYLKINGRHSKTHKRTFNNIINDILDLVQTTCIDFDIYFSILYDTSILLPTNIIRTDSHINTLIHTLVNLHHDLKSEHTYILNTTTQLSNCLVEYILHLEHTSINDITYTRPDSTFINKNWSSLSTSQLEIAFKDFSTYYISTIFINEYPGIIPRYSSSILVDKLYNTLLTMYSTSKLTNSNIKWTKKTGRIDNIKNLLFNLDTMLFIIQCKNPTNSSNTSNKNTISIISNVSIATLNNTILKYLYTIKHSDKNWTSVDIDESKLFSFFKQFYHVNKLSKSDKKDLYNKTLQLLHALQSIG